MRLFFLLSIIAISCNASPVSEDDGHTIIKGHIKNLILDKVYLANAYHWEKLIDSAVVTDGHYVFDIDSSKREILSQTSLEYINSEGQINKLKFNNTILSQNGSRYVLDSFMPDSSTITITGDIDKSEYLFVSAGMETRALFTTQMMDFGFIDPNAANKKQQFDLTIKIIKDFPESEYLLGKIYSNKSLYTKDEFLQLSGTFHEKAIKTQTGQNLTAYIKSKPVKKQPIPNFEFEDSKGKRMGIYKESANLNMIVLWASWCGPCLQEMPILNAIYDRYHQQGLNMVSVSIDEDKTAWINMLRSTKMPWLQVIVDSTQRSVFHKTIDFDSIPIVLFIDNNGSEIQRFVGYDSLSRYNYERTIRTNLKH